MQGRLTTRPTDPGDGARVLVTRILPDGGLDPLVARGYEIVQRGDDTPYSADELATAVADVDAVVCLLTDRIDEAVLSAGAAGRLKVVANVAVGFDNIAVAAARRLGIDVCNTPGVLDETTADLAFLLILAACRLGWEAERDLRAGTWAGWGINQYLGRDVHGAVLGLVGYGRVGAAVARRAEGFGMKVLHHTRHDTGVPGFTPTLDELLTEADIVSLHVPLNDASRHLIGRRELELMGDHAVLVNTARGPVVDEEALADALHDGTIFAAGLDVYEREPEIHPRLLDAPRTVLLPHIGSATQATRAKMAQMACNAVCAVLDGSRPPNLVTT
jgi:glyoxylate reductase